MKRAAEVARNGSRFLVACHRRPDADSLGSALGLIAMLRALGKEATLFMAERIPDSVAFLVEEEQGVASFEPGVRFDATWIMDIAAKKLLPPGFPGPEVTGPLVVIDHHHAHDDFGDIVVRDSSAAATAEVVIALFEAVGLQELPQGSATPLYAAIVSDTGGFRYASTRPETLRLGARLVEAGAEPWRVAYHLFEDWEPARLKLLARIVSTLELAFDGRVAIMRVTRQMIDETSANDDMVEGMVNYARGIKGAEIGALLWEWPVLEGGADHLETKISLRSSGSVDVSSIAKALEGGGHRSAAATQLPLTIDEAEARLRATVAAYFE